MFLEKGKSLEAFIASEKLWRDRAGPLTRPAGRGTDGFAVGLGLASRDGRDVVERYNAGLMARAERIRLASPLRFAQFELKK